MSNRRKLITLIVVLGPCVLLSYYVAAQYNLKGIDALWGNMPDNIKIYYPIGMLIATLGFFPFTYLIVFHSVKPNDYLLPYLFVLLPSSLWMPLTVSYINSPTDITWFAIRIVLLLVAFGAILIYIRMKNEFKQTNLGLYKWALFGVLGFIAHTLLLDGLLWPYFFK